MKKYSLPILMVLIAGCSTVSNFQYPPVRWLRDSDTAQIARPKAKLDFKYSETKFGVISENAEDVLWFVQDMASMPAGAVLSGRIESTNVNNFDEVADSTWFTNRMGRTSQLMNPFKTPPSLQGKWKVLAMIVGKADGEFVIQDAHKNNYLIKIDKDPDDLVSSGELLGALILSNAGYNVTENYVFDFDARILEKGFLPPGKYRALAVRIPKGEDLGHFEFQGKRKDDPNDRIPHEYRREVCALKVFASLLNNRDISTKNTLDVYDNGHVTHYLANFNGSFANMRSEYLSDISTNEGRTLDALFSFGFYNPYLTNPAVVHPKYKGILSSDKFQPKNWQPDKPNLAFRYMSFRDAFWAAKILQQFTDEDIKTIIAMSGYKDEAIRKRIVAEVVSRRDKITTYYFQQVNALDNFNLDNGLEFDDLRISTSGQYRYRIGDVSGRAFGHWQQTTTRAIPLPVKIKETTMVQIQTLRDSKKNYWTPSVDVYIEDKNGPTILGIQRRYYH